MKKVNISIAYFGTHEVYDGSPYDAYHSVIIEDIETIQELVRKLRHAGAYVNRSCGIHLPLMSQERITTARKRTLQPGERRTAAAFRSRRS